ncbi:hypothetical protein [Streptomyces sp. NPDC018352]|uniref:hypothetical protein n=1 Tax=Streptomyces sp. NPDC018352 TaxID=3157194 RepID=UPI0033C06A2E
MAEARAKRDELAVPEDVLERVSEQFADERAVAVPIRGRAVMLIPHRTPGVEKPILPPDFQSILAAVWQAVGPVMT